MEYQLSYCAASCVTADHTALSALKGESWYGPTKFLSATWTERFLIVVEGWLIQAVGSIITAAVVLGVAWLIVASIKGYFDGMTRGLRGDDEQ